MEASLRALLSATLRAPPLYEAALGFVGANVAVHLCYFESRDLARSNRPPLRRQNALIEFADTFWGAQMTTPPSQPVCRLSPAWLMWRLSAPAQCSGRVHCACSWTCWRPSPASARLRSSSSAASAALHSWLRLQHFDVIAGRIVNDVQARDGAPAAATVGTARVCDACGSGIGQQAHADPRCLAACLAITERACARAIRVSHTALMLHVMLHASGHHAAGRAVCGKGPSPVANLPS